MVTCFGAVTNNGVDTNGIASFSAVTPAAIGSAADGCMAFRVLTRQGFVQSMMNTTGPCPPWDETMATTVPATMPLMPPPASASSSSTVDKPVPTELKSVPVVRFDIGLSGSSLTLTPFAVADPCVAVQLRKFAAALIGSDVTKLALTYVTDGNSGLTIPLLPTSPANMINSLPAGCVSIAGSRRLLGSESARMLPSSTNLNLGLQAVVPAGTSAASYAAAVNTLAPSATVAGLSASYASGSAAAGNATVIQAIAYPPRLGGYEPDALITLFHSIPRFDPMASVKPTNEFSLDLGYIKGALYPAGESWYGDA